MFRGGETSTQEERGNERRTGRGGREKERRRWRENTGLDLSTRRICNYFSVPVSFMGKKKEGGGGGGKGVSGKPRSSHPVYLHPSGYRDCGLSPHRSRSLRGTLEWPRRLSALSARLSFTIPLLLFPQTSRIPEDGRDKRGKEHLTR